MTTTLEKVVFLKRVGIFAALGGEDLVELAAITEEVEVPQGQDIIREGQVDNSLFVVVEGKVRVRKEGQVVAELGPGEVFGELALLDPAPRTASVSAVGDVALLRIEGDAFEQIVRENYEIARGITRVLARRLRAAGVG